MAEAAPGEGFRSRRPTWQQRHTLSREAEKIMQHQEDLRNEIRGMTRFI